MGHCIRLCAAAFLVATTAACELQPQEEFVIREPEPISVARTATGKY